MSKIDVKAGTRLTIKRETVRGLRVRAGVRTGDGAKDQRSAHGQVVGCNDGPFPKVSIFVCLPGL
jgi:hypothetical protein